MQCINYAHTPPSKSPTLPLTHTHTHLHTRFTSQTDSAGVLSRARFWPRAFLDRAQLNDFTLRCFCCCFLWALKTKKGGKNAITRGILWKIFQRFVKRTKHKARNRSWNRKAAHIARIVPQATLATSATATTTTIYQSFTRARVQERPVRFSKKEGERGWKGKSGG